MMRISPSAPARQHATHCQQAPLTSRMIKAPAELQQCRATPAHCQQVPLTRGVIDAPTERQCQATTARWQRGSLTSRMIAAFAHGTIKAPAAGLRFTGLWLTPLLSLLLAACQTTTPSAPPQESPIKNPLPAESSAPDESGIPSGTPIDEMPLPEGEFSFEGGDGSTLAKAVIVIAPTERIGVAALYGWIGRHYPGSTAAGQNTVIKNGRFYDSIDVITGEKERRTFYFDITQFFGKY